MLISESQLKNIINEEIQKMINEGEIDEAFLDTLRGKAAEFGSTASRLAGLTGSKASTSSVADDKIAAQKLKAKEQIQKKIQVIKSKISSIELGDLDELYEFAKILQYKGGGDHTYVNLDPIRNSADQLSKRLDTILKDISSGRLSEDELEESE
jgi:hypothetical protein